MSAEKRTGNTVSVSSLKWASVFAFVGLCWLVLAVESLVADDEGRKIGVWLWMTVASCRLASTGSLNLIMASSSGGGLT